MSDSYGAGGDTGLSQLATNSGNLNKQLGNLITSLGTNSDSLITELASILTALNTNSAALVTAINSQTSAIQAIFPRVSGTFTLGAAATLVVTQTAVTATSIIVWTPTNASAGTLQGSVKCLYLSARTVGASFTVATASGGAAASGETFQYFLWNPS